MTQKCPADVQSQNNLTLKRHGYAIMSEGVLGFDLSGPSCCLSIERQRTVLNVVFKLFTQERGGGGSVGLVLSCPGYFCTNVSLFSHVNCAICYAAMDIY